MRTRFGTLLIAFFDFFAGVLVAAPSILLIVGSFPPKIPLGIVALALFLTTIIAGVTLIVAGTLVAFSGLWGLRQAVRWQYSATVWMGLAAGAAYWDTMLAGNGFSAALTGLLYYALGGLTILTLFGALRLHLLYNQSLPEVAE